ncbi:MAG: 4Fe-4S dicluster domain-containing protein [Nitrososphaerales archaeon]
MFKKYHIHTELAPSKKKNGRISVERNLDYCINCGDCIRACLYEVHKRRQEDARIMAEPDSYKCKGCFRCIIECPQNALSLHDNPEFFKLGDSYYAPKMIQIILNEAEDGRVPVSGAGYRGNFSGPGFDRIWTDMSEIVRPTRDGIHGREYISTAVDLGRKLPYLKFNSDKDIDGIPPSIEIPLPIILDPPPYELNSKLLQSIVANAATKLGTYAIINADDYQELRNYNVIPRFSPDSNLDLDLAKGARIVEVDYSEDFMENWRRLKDLHPDVLVSIRMPFKKSSEPLIKDLAKGGVEIFHLYADYQAEKYIPSISD